MDHSRAFWIRLVVAAAVIVTAGSDTTASLSGTASPAENRWSLQVASADVSSAIRTRLSSRSVPELGALSATELQALESLYAPTANSLWIDIGGRSTENVQTALDLFDDAAAQGLDPRDYGSPQLRQLTRAFDGATRPPSPDEIAVLDVAMSGAALRYFTHLHLGRIDPSTLGFRLHVPAEGHDMTALLRSALSEQRFADVAAELVPPLAPYRQLRDMLDRYRAIVADANLPPVPIFARTLRPGDAVAGPGLQSLSHRLVALGDLVAEHGSGDPATYDELLVQAVRQFQHRHGLEPDGVIGPATQAALAVPLSWRVRQIELALERLRWLPDLTNERIIGLNIPMFHLWAWDAVRPDGIPTLSTRAIVGRALRTETPVFVEELREVIFRPYWNVPRSILVSEILPAAQKDPQYLQRQAMEIVQGPGDDARPVPATGENLTLLRRGALRLRQRPGPRNALGLVKFVFPNSDNVYLHSTPAQELFSKARRDFSHGCVRVEDPVSLAEWVLKAQAGWTRDRIVEAMSAMGPRRVTVEQPIQVVLFYVTAAVVPDEGTLHFADDIYRHDAALDRALGGRQQ